MRNCNGRFVSQGQIGVPTSLLPATDYRKFSTTQRLTTQIPHQAEHEVNDEIARELAHGNSCMLIQSSYRIAFFGGVIDSLHYACLLLAFGGPTALS